MSDPGQFQRPAGAGWPGRRPETTGAHLALLADDQELGVAALRAAVGDGATVVAGDLEQLSAADLSAPIVVFDRLGVAVVSATPGQAGAVYEAASRSEGILLIEEERVVRAIADGVPSRDYLLGYRAGVEHLVGDLTGDASTSALPSRPTATWDESRLTWGLQACGVPQTRRTGRGVAVAVLDTGLDELHPDFTTRGATARSFVPGEEAHDGHGHGTHCIGTACGPASPTELPRYGVAPEAEIFAGKVLSDAGSGTDRSILAGIQWAVANGCRVASMSLGAPVAVGTPYSRVFEQAARRALAAGTVIVAAAGNDSRRPGVVQPVSHPANCPSILAVAALESDLAVAPFSNAGRDPDGGQVDLAAPGVDVHSSWPEPLRWRRISGTSMATPHVAGVVALLAEQDPQATPAELKNLLLQGARRLEQLASDVGAGLVQAP